MHVICQWIRLFIVWQHSLPSSIYITLQTIWSVHSDAITCWLLRTCLYFPSRNSTWDRRGSIMQHDCCIVFWVHQLDQGLMWFTTSSSVLPRCIVTVACLYELYGNSPAASVSWEMMNIGKGVEYCMCMHRWCRLPCGLVQRYLLRCVVLLLICKG